MQSQTGNQVLVSFCVNVSGENAGNVISWNDTDTEWEMNNISEEELEESELCDNVKDRSFYMMPENRSLEDALVLCDTLGTSVLERNNFMQLF